MSTCDPWTEDEMIQIIESKTFSTSNGERNRALFAIQCATGGRISEVLSLTRGDVVDPVGRLFTRISFTDTKNGETRHVNMVNRFAIPFIKDWLFTQEGQGYCRGTTPLFTTSSGGTVSRFWWYRIIKDVCEECHMAGHYATHSARKTWARDTYRFYHSRAMAGELVDPLLKLQEAGGWKTIEATRRYIAFMLGDTSSSQAALFPGLQERYGNGSRYNAQNYQNESSGG